MTPRERARAWLATLEPLVKWDRAVMDSDGKLAMLAFYGWIARDDGRADFAILWVTQREGDAINFITSSAEHSAAIHAKLTAAIPQLSYSDGTWGEHSDCLTTDAALAMIPEMGE